MRRLRTVWPWMSVSAIIAVLIGAGTSFAPLYLDNWGGDEHHYLCPMIGGRNVDDPRVDAGLCVTPLAWYVIVTLLCLLLAVAFAVYCEMAMRLDTAGGLHAGGVMTRSARRAWHAMLWTLPAFMITTVVLMVLTGKIWLLALCVVAAVAVWTQGAWHICDRIGLSLRTRTVNDTLAAVWGIGVVLTTHALVCFRVTFSGGVVGAVLAACCSWAIASVSDDGDVAGEQAAADRRISVARGVIALIVQWMMAYNVIRPLTAATTATGGAATRLCAQFWVSETGVRISSCSPEGFVPLLSTVGLIVVVAALPLGVCAAMACHFGRWALSRSLYAAAGLCTATAFVIGVTLA